MANWASYSPPPPFAQCLAADPSSETCKTFSSRTQGADNVAVGAHPRATIQNADRSHNSGSPLSCSISLSQLLTLVYHRPLCTWLGVGVPTYRTPAGYIPVRLCASYHTLGVHRFVVDDGCVN